MATDKANFLLVLAGPTASGKTSLALELARRHGGTIISADSRQLYREFDIGTAKPTIIERSTVPHRLIDCLEPTATFTLADYQQLAHRAIEEAHEKGSLPILVGGTGLYIRSIVGGLDLPNVPPDAAFREEIKQRGNLHEALAKVDEAAAARLHPNDHTRLIRALEVHHFTGKKISDLQKKKPCPYPFLFLGLDGEREALYARIDRRTEEMIELGLVQEVQKLIERHGIDLPMLRTLGYAEIVAHLRGESDLKEAIKLIQKNTRNYAKRQITWFRHEADIQMIDGALEEALRQAESLLVSGYD